MKRVSTILILLAVVAVSMLAVPAHKKPIQVTQPDGSTITIQLHGDEWLSFNTTADGYSVVKNQQGYYVYAEKKDGELKATSIVAHDATKRKADEIAFLKNVKKYQAPKMSEEVAATKKIVEQQQRETLAKRRAAGQRAAQYDYNNFKGLVILVQFNDKEFSRDDYASIANGMMNQENYTGYDNEEYTGSVRDYFSDNSGGQFKPEFDIYGPYTVDYSQYEGQSKRNEILVAALTAADADIDYSQYDRDNNGYVELVYFIIAGYGANFSGNDNRLYWPHRSCIVENNNWMIRDGVKIWDYASSVELWGWMSEPSGVKIGGIGTICHEFSHVLGLPDFYDTDYDGSGGQSNDPGDWSLMAGGSYLNDERTPIGYSLYERCAVGFTDPEIVQEINQPGNYKLEPLASSQSGLYLPSPEPQEYFMLENRQKNKFKWDAYMPGNGMLVHRIDFTNPSAWWDNQVNANPSHNYYELLRADGAKGKASSSDPFPGSKKVRELSNTTSPANLKTWAGEDNQFRLYNIQQASNGNITFKVGVYELQGLSFGEIPPIGVGVSYQLEVISDPVSAQYTLTWESKNNSVATVDENGVVTGISAGTCEITATSDNGIQASCIVTIVELPHYTIDAFKQQPVDQVGKLELSDAEVLFAYQKNDIKIAYLRDATGAIMLYDANLPIQTNDILNGTVIVKTGISNKVPQAIGIGESTNDEKLTIVAGSGAQPREVSYEDLTEADYSDLVVVKATKLKRSNGIWAYNGSNRIRVWDNEFGISTGLTSSEKFTGKFYDVTAIYGTDIKSNVFINQLNVTKAVEEVEDPTGIEQVESSKMKVESYYNLAGQRVNNGYKGLVIKNGKKHMNK